MGDLNVLIARMRYWCQSASLGYSQSDRWDIRPGGNADCSSLVIWCLREAGFDTGAASYTGNLSAELTARGWQRLPNDGHPQAGDILLCDADHVAVYLGNGQLAQASTRPEPRPTSATITTSRGMARRSTVTSRTRPSRQDDKADSAEPFQSRSNPGRLFHTPNKGATIIPSHARHKRPPRRTLMPAAAILAILALAFPADAMADSGVDVSNWQGCINAPRAQSAKSAGTGFAIVKATEGTGFTDNTADCTMTGLAQAGIRRAVYHFARPEYGNSPETEADYFISQTRGYVGQGVLPILDWEPGGGQKGNVAWAKRWLDRVAAAWGTKPLIYMSASTISAGDWTPVARADYGLWVAGYPNGYAGDRLRDPGTPPYPLGPWPFAAAWQYSSSGSVPGIGERIDVDWFYGDAVTWSKYANAPLPAAPAVTPGRPVPAPVQSTPKGDASQIASAVIRGEYGNDPQRRALLGSRYDEVMAIVNQRFSGSSASGTGYYTVQPGDYLSKIWPASWRPIAALNGLRPPYVIYPGQRLATGGAASSGRSVVVRSGDTLSSIAARLGISASSLHGYRSGNPNLIYPGEVLAY